MAGKRIEMKDVHSIILMLSQGYGTKHISAVLGCARNTVKAYRAIITSKGLAYEELLSRPEEELEKFFITKKPDNDNRQDRLEEAFSNADSELGKVGVTKFLLWNEYRMSNPDGYSYPQFCKLYRERAETVDVSMHMEHRPGDKLYIDYTGKKIPFVDRSTGEIKDAEIFVTAMGSVNICMWRRARDSPRSALRNACATHCHTTVACLRCLSRTISRAQSSRLTSTRPR